MKKVVSSAFCLFFLLTLVFWSAPENAAAASKKQMIKLQQAYSKDLPVLGTGIQWWAEQVQEASDGSLKIKIYEPGKLVKPFEILDAVSSGKLDAGFAFSGFWAGKLPAAPLFSAIPFGPEAAEYAAWMFRGNGMKLDQEMYDQAGYNVKVLPAVILPPETAGWFKEPINSLDDLKGKKMRFAGYGGKVMDKLGMATTVMPAGELFPALEKGVLDATEFSSPTIDKRLGFYKIAKYNYFPGWHQQATFIDILINKDKWNKLSKSQQKLIEMSAYASVMNSIAEGEASQGSIIKENIEKRGVKTMYWSDEELATFKTLWEEVAGEEAKKYPFFKRAYADLKNFRAEYAYWQKLGFLPRKAAK